MLRRLALIPLLALICAPIVFGQAARYDNFISTVSNPGPGGYPNILAIPGAKIQICNNPANGVPCTNLATTYTDSTQGPTCPTNAQLIYQGSNGCTAVSDGSGNVGFWGVSSTHYQYTATLPTGQSVGPVDIWTPFTGAAAITPIGFGIADWIDQTFACHSYRGQWNVKDCGAKGDGVTDDTNAIRLAISSAGMGGRIYVPTGRYLVNGLLRLLNDQTFQCEAGGFQSGGQALGGAIILVGPSFPATWVFDRTGAQTAGYEINSCTIDLATNSSSVKGAFHIQDAWTRLVGNTELIPNTGNMIIAQWDNNYWNVAFNNSIYFHGLANTTNIIAYQWINAANSNQCINCMASGVNTVFDIESGSAISISGQGSDNWTFQFLKLGAQAGGNSVQGLRAETNFTFSVGVANQALVRVVCGAINNYVGGIYSFAVGTQGGQAIDDACPGRNRIEVNDTTAEYSRSEIGNTNSTFQVGINKVPTSILGSPGVLDVNGALQVNNYQYNLRPGDFRQYATPGGTTSSITSVSATSGVFTFNGTNTFSAAQSIYVGIPANYLWRYSGTYVVGAPTGTSWTSPVPIDNVANFQVTNSTGTAFFQNGGHTYQIGETIAVNITGTFAAYTGNYVVTGFTVVGGTFAGWTAACINCTDTGGIQSISGVGTSQLFTMSSVTLSAYAIPNPTLMLNCGSTNNCVFNLPGTGGTNLTMNAPLLTNTMNPINTTIDIGAITPYRNLTAKVFKIAGTTPALNHYPCASGTSGGYDTDCTVTGMGAPVVATAVVPGNTTSTGTVTMITVPAGTHIYEVCAGFIVTTPGSVGATLSTATSFVSSTVSHGPGLGSQNVNATTLSAVNNAGGVSPCTTMQPDAATNLSIVVSIGGAPTTPPTYTYWYSLLQLL